MGGLEVSTHCTVEVLACHVERTTLIRPHQTSPFTCCAEATVIVYVVTGDLEQPTLKPLSDTCTCSRPQKSQL